MIFTKTLLRGATVLSMMAIIFCSSTYVKANENNITLPLTPSDWSQISDGMKIKYNNSNNGLEVNLSSNGLKKGYYTGTLENKINDNWSRYGMICFNLNNQSEKELRFNLFIDEVDGARLVVGNDKVAIIKNDSSEIMERVHPSYGTLEIPKEFQGTIYIPFNSLEKQGLEKQDKEYTNFQISDWGIIVTSAENEEENFRVNKFGIIDSKAKIVEDSNANITFDGDSQVQIPVVGESIAQYKAISNGEAENVEYEIHNPIKGVTINKEGLLTIKTGVQPQKIEISAMLNDNFSESKEVQLFKSWTLSAKEVDGTSKSIPNPNEVPKLIDNTYKFFLSDIVMDAIRIFFSIVVIMFSGLFIYWRKKKGL